MALSRGRCPDAGEPNVVEKIVVENMLAEKMVAPQPLAARRSEALVLEGRG
jgi:hypothetical protein